MAAFEKQIPENVVEYHVYPRITEGCDVLQALSVFGAECMHVVNELCRDYIWNNQRFHLSIPQQDVQGPPFLYGSTNFGDNVEDEWLVVFVCVELTRRIQGLVVKMEDSDGEFLLIEAAHSLPKWLKPETSENRVFLYAGELHLIPIPSSPAEVTIYPIGTPTLQTALDLVWSSHSTGAAAGVQKAIQARIQGYPEKMWSLLHHAHCLLPLPAAHVLSCNPQLIAPAVHALCDRDRSDMKVCQQMQVFGNQECVMTRVRFSQYLYAMLTHEQFALPQHPAFRLPARSSSQFKAHELGMKLVCGMEILVSRGGQVAGEDTPDVSSRAAVQQDPHWPAFLQSLKEKGFFRGELDGSQLHRTLMKEAEAFFADMICKEEKGGIGHASPSPAAEIRRILSSVPCEEKEFRDAEKSLEPADDDSWLEVTPSQLDQMLSQYSGGGRDSRSKEAEPVEGVEQLEAMVSSMKMFMGKVSSHEGAEFPWVADDSRAVDFDPQAVLEDVRRLLGVKGDGGSGEMGSSSDVSGDDDSDASSSDGQEEDQEMLDIMSEMDRQLAHTEVGKSFAPPPVLSDSARGKEDTKEEEGDGEDLLPLDVDFNLMSNLLESYAAQCGEAGPSSNILHTLGIRLPPEESQHNHYHQQGGSEGDSASHTD